MKIEHLLVAAACLGTVDGCTDAGDPKPTSTTRYTRTIVRLEANGTQSIRSVPLAEAYALGSKRRDDSGNLISATPSGDDDGYGESTQEISTDANCGGSAMWLFAGPYLTGSEICFSGVGTANLASYGWNLQAHSFWAGQDAGYFDPCTRASQSFGAFARGDDMPSGPYAFPSTLTLGRFCDPSTAQLSPDDATQPLRMWRSQSGDTSATTGAPDDQSYFEQTPIGSIASVSAAHEAMVPLVSWYSASLRDFLTTSDQAWGPNTSHGDYGFVRFEGYVYPSDPGGAVPLMRWLDPQTGDNLTTTSPIAPQGYQLVRSEGFVRPWIEPPPHGPPMVRVVSASQPNLVVVAGQTVTTTVQIERLPLSPEDQQLFGIDHYDGEVIIEAKAFDTAVDPGDVRSESNVIHGTAVIPAGQTSAQLTIDVSSLADASVYDLHFGGTVDAVTPSGPRFTDVTGTTSLLMVTRPCGDACPPYAARKVATWGVSAKHLGLQFIVGNNTPRETGFTIEMSTSGGAWTTVQTFAPLAAPNTLFSTDFPGITPTTAYCFRVKVTNAIASTYSKEVCATTMAAPPPPVPPTIGLTVAPCDNKVKITVTYLATQPATYELYRGTVLLKSWTFGGSLYGGTGTVTYVDATTVVGGEYSYSIKSTYGEASGWSDVAKIKVPPCTPPPPAPAGVVDFSISLLTIRDDETGMLPRYYSEAFAVRTLVCNVGGLASPAYKDKFVQQAMGATSPTKYIVDTTYQPKSPLKAGGCEGFELKYTSGVILNFDLSNTREFVLTVADDVPKYTKTRLATIPFMY